ncbi:MAG: MFS transporter [Thermoproteus sp.]|nr:MFS transporter [Thermoproteus sp.]
MRPADMRNRGYIAVVGATRFVRYFILGHLAVSLPIALEAATGSAAAAGLVLTIAGLISLASSIAYSAAGDVIGHARGLAVVELAFALGVLSIAHLKNPWLLAVALGLGGIGTLGPGATRGAFVPLILAVVRDHSVDSTERTKSLGLINLVSTAGGVLGSAAAALLPLNSAVDALYAGAAAAAAASILIALGLRERARAVNPFAGLSGRASEVFGYSLSQFVAGIGVGLSMPLLSLWLHSYMKLGEGTIGLLFAVGNGAFAAASLFAYKFVQTLGLVKASVVSRIISGLLLASLPLFKNVYLFAAVYSLYNAFVGIGGAARSSYISGIALEGSEATTPAVTNIAIRASSTPAIALSGYLIEAL